MNLDEFNALVASFYSDADRALALQGLTLGCNGGACPNGAPDAFKRACELGLEWRSEAEEYRNGRAENGAKGGRPKTKPCGSPKARAQASRSMLANVLVRQTAGMLKGKRRLQLRNCNPQEDGMGHRQARQLRH